MLSLSKHAQCHAEEAAGDHHLLDLAELLAATGGPPAFVLILIPRALRDAV